MKIEMPPSSVSNTAPRTQENHFSPAVEKVKKSWKEWNTSRISSAERQGRKIESLNTLAKELASKDQTARKSVEQVERDFFAQGLDKSVNAVKTLLNHYCNFADSIADQLAELADEQLMSNSWRSS